VNKIIIFQQYGAQRSGTNYCKELFNRNYKNLKIIEFLNSKHHIAPSSYTVNKRTTKHIDKNYDKQTSDVFLSAILKNEIKNFIITRNPYAWIESLWRFGFEIEHGPESYIYFQKPPPEKSNVNWLFERPSLEKQQHAVEKSIMSYNMRYEKWFETATEIVRQEDLLFDYRLVLKYFEQKYDLIKTQTDFFNIKEPCGPYIEFENCGSDKNDFYKNYYLNHKYMNKLPTSTINLITQTVDWELFRGVGYYPFE
jgi:hypothetical protein